MTVRRRPTPAWRTCVENPLGVARDSRGGARAALMPPRPYILNELTWKDVRDARYEVAVLPWGACEPHNRHLPYSTDNVETERIAELAARIAWDRGARVVVLPVVPFGVNTGQLDLPLCLNMNPSTQALVLRDVATALGGQRVPKLVILNGHGGNDFRQMIRELQPAVSLFLCVSTGIRWWIRRRSSPISETMRESSRPASCCTSRPSWSGPCRRPVPARRAASRSRGYGRAGRGRRGSGAR